MNLNIVRLIFAMLQIGIVMCEVNEFSTTKPKKDSSAIIFNDDAEAKIVQDSLNSAIDINAGDHGEGYERLEFKNKTTKEPVRLDKFFGVDCRVFEKYLEKVDLKVIPGYRDDDDFENWVPPLDIQKDLPIYMSGFDFQNRPLWIIEYGRYNYSKYANSGRKYQSLFDKYYRYISYVALKARALRSTEEKRIEQYALLIDFEGLVPEQILDSNALRLQLKWISSYRRFTERHVYKVILLNVNHLSESLFTLAKTFILQLVDRIEVYSTEKRQWLPQLLKEFPKDQLPEWYGGSKGFKPLYVIG